MRFVHNDPNFGQIVATVGEKLDINPGQIEKDYWITHVLWALHAVGLEVWFKGGTCLSKGYKLIERFSEDLDVKLGTGTAPGLPPSPNWKGERDTHIAKRAAWFDALAKGLSIDGCRITVNQDMVDERARSAVFEVHYPGEFIAGLGPVISPWVRLEIGSARMTPALYRPISSWIHDELDARAVWSRFDDNRPPPVHCVHPAVTLLEKLDAITRRWPRADLPGRAFVRHYEDAASIIAALPTLPAVPGGLEPLMTEMVAHRQLRGLVSANDPAFMLESGERTHELHVAWTELAPLYWGTRVPLGEAAARIRGWISENIYLSTAISS